MQQNIKLGQKLLLQENHTTNSCKQKIPNTFQYKYIMSIHGCFEIKWQNFSLSKSSKKIIASKIINWKNKKKKKKSLTNSLMLYPNKKSHILWCYTQIKNLKHSHEEDRNNWPKVDRQKRSGFEAERRLGMASGSVTLSFGGGDVKDELGRRQWNWEVRVWESELERVLRDGNFRWEWH